MATMPATFQRVHRPLSQPGVLPAGVHAVMENEYMMTTPSMILQSTMATAMRDNQGSISHPPSSDPGRVGGEQLMPNGDYPGGMPDSFCR